MHSYYDLFRSWMATAPHPMAESTTIFVDCQLCCPQEAQVVWASPGESISMPSDLEAQAPEYRC